jgi:UDP-N-acetylglucosamine/UDP-N-acetylgalactosamine diphosphorylase
MPVGRAKRSQPELEDQRGRYDDHGQSHVFRFWDRLDETDRQRLLAQAAAIDLPVVLRAYQAARSALDAEPEAVGRLDPPPVERLPGRGGDAARADLARERGEQLLSEGRVAALVVAGGQATRLGYDAPKGAFPLGPVSERSLFELQAQKIRNLRSRFGRPLPWYVMTSEATDAPTREFFARHDHFGIPSEDVFFFRQEMVPSFDLQGRLLLSEPHRIFENPSGHGGAPTALLNSGALDDMDSRGVDTLFYYQVDNPLVRIADPVYLGFHDEAGAEMSCKVVRKIDPAEKVGLVVRRNGRLGMIEYTELDEEHGEARDESGDLVYWAGNIAIHVFATSFLRRVANDAEALLPYHPARKAIPTVDDDGRPLVPSEPNGLKLERFVFDALPAAERTSVVEADRAVEFSPVKNADGDSSPETARRDLSTQVRGWIESAGIAGLPTTGPVEVDHTRIDSLEDARAMGIRTVDEAPETILTPPGETS